jgi:hypothetical protein
MGGAGAEVPAVIEQSPGMVRGEIPRPGVVTRMKHLATF